MKSEALLPLLTFALQVSLSLAGYLADTSIYRNRDGSRIKVVFGFTRYAYINLGDQNPLVRMFLVEGGQAKLYLPNMSLVRMNLSKLMKVQETSPYARHYQDIVYSFRRVQPAFRYVDGVLYPRQELVSDFDWKEYAPHRYHITDRASNFQVMLNARLGFDFHAFKLPGCNLVVRIGRKNILKITTDLGRIFHYPQTSQGEQQQHTVAEPTQPQAPTAPTALGTRLGPIGPSTGSSTSPAGSNSNTESQSDQLNESFHGWRPFDPNSWTLFP